MEAIAKTRHLKGSPRKARLVIDLIRGRNVSQALNILKFTDKRAADPIEKTLRSAIANATYLAEQQNIAIDPDDLFVKTCFVDMGAHKNRRRMRPAPQGRAFREQRHYCHITILVSSDVPAEKTKSAKESERTSAEKGDGGQTMKAAPKPKPAKKAAKTETAKETPKVKETKKAKAEKTVVAELVEEAQVVETPVVSDPVAEMMHTKETPEAEKPTAEEKVETASPVVETAAETKTAEASEVPAAEEPTAKTEAAETPKAEEIVEAQTVAPKVEEPKAETAKVEETKEVKAETAKKVEPEKPAEPKAAKAEKSKVEEKDQTETEEDSDILEVSKPTISDDKKAAKKDAKADAEIANAKNVQSQTPAERNDTKKADEAQQDENDILELQ